MKPEHTPIWILGLLGLTMAYSNAQDAEQSPPESSEPKIDLGAPTQVTDKDFEHVKESSPFTRSLNLSDSLMLTAIMNVGETTTATVIDKETKELYVVSDKDNPQGWRMVGVEGDRNDLEKLTAKISIGGGEVVSVRFDETQLKPDGVKAAGAKDGGGKGDGRGPGGGGFKGPPPHVMEKMRSLSDDQRKKLGEYMHKMRTENPDMSREQMRDHFYKAVERLGGGGGGGDRSGGGDRGGSRGGSSGGGFGGRGSGR